MFSFFWLIIYRVMKSLYKLGSMILGKHPSIRPACHPGQIGFPRLRRVTKSEPSDPQSTRMVYEEVVARKDPIFNED